MGWYHYCFQGFKEVFCLDTSLQKDSFNLFKKHCSLYCSSCPVGWGCRIYRLLLCRRVRTLPTNECPVYDTKQSDNEVPVMRELWGMQSIPSLLSLPGPLWPGVVVPDRVRSIGQIELNCVLMLNWIIRNRTILILKLFTELNCLK